MIQLHKSIDQFKLASETARTDKRMKQPLRDVIRGHREEMGTEEAVKYAGERDGWSIDLG